MPTCPTCNDTKGDEELCPAAWKKTKGLCKRCDHAVSAGYRSTRSGAASVIMKHTRDAARKRKRHRPQCGEVEVTKQDILAMADAQGGVCAVSGMAMEWTQNSPYKVSLDRKDPSKGYLRDNVRLVCWIVNSAMSDFAFDDFLTMCKSVAGLHK